jgi:hypothetical protein
LPLECQRASRQTGGALELVEIRKRFGDSHPALSVVNFDEKTWFDINAATISTKKVARF